MRIYSVSIPHRFNSHQSLTFILRTTNGCFNPSQVQFTQALEALQSGLLRFQSLTGSIHTDYNVDIEDRSKVFQSLTGSIHTTPKHQKQKNCKFVSIPHRFNSHEQFVNISVMEGICFNPSQVQFTQIGKYEILENLAVFQSLTGSIHTDKRNTLNKSNSHTII